MGFETVSNGERGNGGVVPGHGDVRRERNQGTTSRNYRFYLWIRECSRNVAKTFMLDSQKIPDTFFNGNVTGNQENVEVVEEKLEEFLPLDDFIIADVLKIHSNDVAVGAGEKCVKFRYGDELRLKNVSRIEVVNT